MFTLLTFIFGDRRVLSEDVRIPRWFLILMADIILVQMVIHLATLGAN